MLPDDDFERTHPSYGLVYISRITHSRIARRLFGSPLAHHYGTIRLSIGGAKWIHHLHRDHYQGDIRGEHIEIEMSAAQFADMITSLNMGGGTPCTIRRLTGKEVSPPPDHATEAEHIRDNFEDSLDKYKAKAHEYRQKIEELTAKLSEKAKKEIRIALNVIEDQLAQNVPFMMAQFQEATTRVTSAAKAEVDAYVTGVVRDAGLEAIAGGRRPSLLPAAAENVEGMCKFCGSPDHQDDMCVRDAT
jgi:hypothetical protein